MVKRFLELDTADYIYFGQFGTGLTQLDNEKWFTGHLNTLVKYKGKILVINIHYAGSYRDINKPVT